jgi:hypothetical protein
MSEVESGPAPGAAAGDAPGEGSSLGHLIGALTAPRAAFASIARAPTTAVALVLLVLSGVLALHFAMSRVTAESFLASIEESGREVPQEMRDDPERFLTIARWTQTIGAVLLGPALYFALAGVFLVLFRLLGSELTYRQSLATTVHGMLPFGVAALVGVAVALGRDEITMAELQWGGVVVSNLGFLAGEEAGKAARALLTSVDLFSAWCVYLLATGYRIGARVGVGAAWSVVLTVWSLGILVKLGLAVAF